MKTRYDIERNGGVSLGARYVYRGTALAFGKHAGLFFACFSLVSALVKRSVRFFVEALYV